MTNETKRKIEHIVPVVFAFLLRYLNIWQALLFALVGILYGLFFSRVLVKTAFREDEQGKRFSSGKLLYGIMVFILITLFNQKMYIAAGAWAIMSLGDGFSGLLGRALGRKKLPWNPQKSWIGSAAFVFFGGMGAGFFMWWVNVDSSQAPLAWSYLFISAFLASFTAAVVESLPLKVNDNITVPLSAGLFLYASSIVNWEYAGHAHSVVVALCLNISFGFLAYYLHTVSKSGFIGGIIVGTIIYLCLGLGGFLILFTFFALGSWSSKHKYKWKASHGAAQENMGRRSSKHAIAKGGVGLVMAIMALLADTPEIFTVSFVAAFATATFDTISSELGQIYGKKPLLITTMKYVPVGTDGAISIEGTVFGVLSASIVAAEAYFLHLINSQSIIIVIIAALIGTTVESILGATIERRKWVDNEVVNFINISTGAAASMLMVKVM